ncbi:putative transmembrane protein [Sinorhizobium sp. CCBAU 05631]|nr:putative transmembrane protein [Sinorhizobium sp. CCBAU 05631]AWM25082.1 putative transmembrane protein [Sinorhizobium fredii CCBAU 25509]
MSAMTEISYLWPLTGGLLIGLSAALYLLLNGRIAGISGLAAAAAGLTEDGDSKLGLGFLLGIIAGAWLAAALARKPEIVITSSPALLIAAGLIVGYGTRLGSGCTSGHGVCGVARLSPRSLAATAIFMAVAGATVFITRHLLGVQS